MMNTRAVDIFEFSDPKEYLRVLLSSGKRTDPKASRLKSIAERAGFRSPSTISMIVNGKRVLSAKSAIRIAAAVGLRGPKKRYFLAMVQLSQARSLSEEAKAQESMLQIRARSERALIQIQQYRFLSIWYYPVLYVLAGMQKVNWEPTELAKRLGHGLSPRQVQQAIKDLKSLGLFFEEEGGGKRCVRKLAARLSTEEEVLHLGVHRYHEQMAKLGQEALDLALATREMNGITFALPTERLAEAKECVREFRRQMHERFSPMEAESDQVYQLNLQLFPLTSLGNESNNEGRDENEGKDE